MKKLFFVFAFIIPIVIHAQTTKTDVLVIGNGIAAFSAGVQASESGVNSIILTQSDGFKLGSLKLTPTNGVVKAFEKRAKKSLKLVDSARIPELNNQVANAIIKNWSDSSKFLKVINDTPVYGVKRSGMGWEIKLTKDKSIKAKVLIIADTSDKLISILKITNIKLARLIPLAYSENLYRTSIAGVNGNYASILSLYSLLVSDQENLLYIDTTNINIGAAAGATGAYAAFYKTKTSLSNLKRIQGELLSYQYSLIPFEDVEVTDSNWLAIEKIGITGIVKGEIMNGKVFFHPEKIISENEILQPIKDYYYKAQIWFDDHQNIPMNLENTISMVCYVGNKSVDATKAELQKKWNKNYRFSSKYDLKKVLSRREFSVIINEYLKPFDEVNVDKSGRVIR